MRTRLRQRGFTLIEIIVVVLVFSIMSVMAYGGLRSVLDTRRGIEASMSRTAELQRAFLRMRGDFQNLRDRPARDGFGDVQPPLSIDREGTLLFVRGGWRSPLHSARSSLERVRYRIQDGVLRRATWKVVDLPQDSEPVDLVLLRGVKELRWRFLGTDREWHEQWPADRVGAAPAESAPAAPPPIAIEITLVTRDWGELRFVFRAPQAALTQAAGAVAGGASEPSLLTREGLLPIEQLQLQGAPPPTDTPTAPDDDTPPDEPEPDSNPPGGGTNSNPDVEGEAS